jgi:hypothetical protein
MKSTTGLLEENHGLRDLAFGAIFSRRQPRKEKIGQRRVKAMFLKGGRGS